MKSRILINLNFRVKNYLFLKGGIRIRILNFCTENYLLKGGIRIQIILNFCTEKYLKRRNPDSKEIEFSRQKSPIKKEGSISR